MIVKNEEKVLARCLDSVKDLVDEIIIVDTGSSDKTKEIAREYTDKIYDYVWVDDFSAARNFSYSKASMDYTFWLDADDIILEEDKIKFNQLKENLDPSIDIVMMKYNATIDDFNNPTLSYYRERLTKRANNHIWKEPVHEYLELSGNIINSDICITHKKDNNDNSDRNLSIYEKIVSKGEELSTRGLYYYGRELYNWQRYEDSIKYINKFLDSNLGWVEDNIGSCHLLSQCYQCLNDREGMLNSLLKSFKYDKPRAEICCQLGQFYMDDSNYQRAIVWLTLATQLKKPEDNWGFIQHDYWGYIPNMQLCVCYYKIGKIKEAIKYNEKAAEFKPHDSVIAYNRSFFETLS